jgi:phytoene desaturase
MSSFLIIGAGISGLASAALLARDGHTVTVLEARKDVGGRAGSWERRGFRFDTGPSWFLMPEVFDHFYRLMGTSIDEQLALVTLDPGYRVYFEGEKEPLEISASRDENIELFERIEKGAGARLDRYLESARETYEMAKERFLYTSFEDLRPVMTRDVRAQLPKFGRLLLEPLSRLVARTVRDRRLRQILGYPAVFLGSSPKLTPSMYHLMSHLDLSDGVYYPMGGFARVIETIAGLAKEAGAKVVTGASVTRIVVEHGAATGVEYTDKKGDVQFLDADFVVSAADLHHTETQLLEPEQRSYPEEYWQSRVAGPGALLLYLGVRGELPELEHHTLLFTKNWQVGFDAIFGANPSVPAPASLYVCKPSGVDPDVAPEGSENLFVLVPIPADPTIGHGGVDRGGDERIEALADQVIAQIAEWTGIDDLASRITVRRTVGPGDFADDLHAWKGTALGPAHTLRQSAFFRPGNVSRKVARLYYVGSSTIPGIGLPMCLISAEVLLKRLRGDTTTTPLSEPLVESVSVADAATREERQALAAVSEATAAARAARAARVAAFTAATKQAAGRVGRVATWAGKAVAAAATAAVVTIKSGIEAQRSAPEAETADAGTAKPEAAAFAGEELVVVHAESTELVVAEPTTNPRTARPTKAVEPAEEPAEEPEPEAAVAIDDEPEPEPEPELAVEDYAEPADDEDSGEALDPEDGEVAPEDEPEASDDAEDDDAADEDEDDESESESENGSEDEDESEDVEDEGTEDEGIDGEDSDGEPAKRPYWLEEDYDADAIVTEKEGRPYWLDEPEGSLAGEPVEDDR